MSLIERFTRDAASKYIWAGLALAAAIGLAYSVSHRGRAVDQEGAVAEGRAVGYVEGVLSPRLDSRELAAPISGQQAESLEAVVRRSILDDERVSRVRIWSTDGTLLFSTDPSDHPGSDEGLNDPVLRDASREGPLTRERISPMGAVRTIPSAPCCEPMYPSGPLPLLRSIRRMRGPSGPSERHGSTISSSRVGCCCLLLVMTAISLRDPIERINTGIPFAASSIPRRVLAHRRRAVGSGAGGLSARLGAGRAAPGEARRVGGGTARTRELHPTEAVKDRVRRRRSPPPHRPRPILPPRLRPLPSRRSSMFRSPTW